MSRNVLNIKNLHIHFKTYEGIPRVIDGINIKVDEEESIALIGETGCGKSVTLKAILGILPTPPATISGQIIFKGRDLLKMSRNEIGMLRGTEITFIPQDPMSSLCPVFTIEEQFKDLITLQGNYEIGLLDYYTGKKVREKQRDAKARVLELLESVALPPTVMKSYPFELSGGMQQRVLIAMALSSNPSLLLADEPGTALDVTTQKKILRLLQSMIDKQSLSMIYVTHNLGVARRIAQKIYVMYAGTIVEIAESNRIFHNARHPYTSGLITSIPKLIKETLTGIEGRVINYIRPPTGCRFYPRCKFAMPVCKNEKPRMRKVEENHMVRCHLYGKLPN